MDVSKVRRWLVDSCAPAGTFRRKLLRKGKEVVRRWLPRRGPEESCAPGRPPEPLTGYSALRDLLREKLHAYLSDQP